MEIHCRARLVSPAIYIFVYSFLKAIIGWTLAALRAGIMQATKATPRSAAPTTAIVAREGEPAP